MKSSAPSRSFASVMGGIVSVVVLAGCGGNYYQITDTQRGKSYYTRDIDRDDGTVRFRDEASGDDVRLSGSEVREITEQQYRNAVRK